MLSLVNPFRTGVYRIAGRRYRRVLIATMITVGVSAVLLGLVGLTRWQSRAALQEDTRSGLAQTGQQMVRSLQRSRGTLTLLRDALNRESGMSNSDLRALGASSVEHTRHLLGVGRARRSEPLVWWSPPNFSPVELRRLERGIIQRFSIAGIWRVPSTFVVGGPERPVLVMVEPLQTLKFTTIIGVFDLKPLVQDFFDLNQQFPVQLLDRGVVLYRSPDWRADTASEHRIVLEETVRMDAAKWTIQMQPGATQVAQTLSWVSIVLVALSVVAGLGVIAIVWLLAARTWLLERAVTRRTAALRRALKRVRQLAITDELTGLYNRRFFLKRWIWEWERATRYARPIACLMMDVNKFKLVNDQLGHAAGDDLLRKVSLELQRALRQSDILARFGGDEFIAALPETTQGQAQAVAEKLRRIRIPLPPPLAGTLPAVTLSVGIGVLEPGMKQHEDVLEAADRALYEQKRGLPVRSLPAHT